MATTTTTPPAQPVRKVQFSHAGDLSAVSIIDTTIPPPRPAEVQVRVLYSGFSGADINMRKGAYPMQRKFPLTPGYCLTGTVVAVGSSTTQRFTPGQLVTSMTIYDAQSTYINLPAKYLIPVPSSSTITPLSATAIVLDWATALGLVEHANIRPGQLVFVHSISGAVGWAVFQLCLLRGAGAVHGTASLSKHDAVRAAGGVPHVYTDKRWMSEMNRLGGADVVFDALGFESFDESYQILRKKKNKRDGTSTSSGGMLVGFGGNLHSLNAPTSSSPSSLSPLSSLLSNPLVQMAKLLALNAKVWDSRSTSFWYITRDDKNFVPNVEKLFGMLASGEIADIPVRQVWDMEDIREAHASWGKGGGVGSLLVKVNDE